MITILLGSMLSANMATKVIKHEVKHEAKQQKKELTHKDKKNNLNVDKAIKKEKRKMEMKAVKAVL